jgi:hypothetical protein
MKETLFVIGIFPEAQRAVERMGEFICQHIK